MTGSSSLKESGITDSGSTSDLTEVEHVEDLFSPERFASSPAQFPAGFPPIRPINELGLPNLSPVLPPKTAHLGESADARLASLSKGPSIYFGEASPTPRWVVKPVGSKETMQDGLRQDSEKESPKQQPSLPKLGELRWVFDAGSTEKHGLGEDWLYEYAYKYLQIALGDPVVRDQLRNNIWNGPYASHIKYVEDPLPILPPPPEFKHINHDDYFDVQSPTSASTPKNYLYLYRCYERPSLAARACDRQWIWDEESTDNDSNARPNAADNPQDRNKSSEYQPENEDDNRHIGTVSDSSSKPRFPLEKPVISKPPKRGRGRDAPQADAAYVPEPTPELDLELDVAEDRGGKGTTRSKRRTKSRRVEAFANDPNGL